MLPAGGLGLFACIGCCVGCGPCHCHDHRRQSRSPPGGDLPRVAPPDAGLSLHARRDRAAWNADADHYQARHGQQLAGDGKAWGTWNLPESELHVLGEIAGCDILELGCGAAQGSIDLARAGARPIGLDLSEGQLAHARRLVAQAGVHVPLIQASAEAVPLADASFDIVFCDHGAMNFADPFRTVPEVARLLRPGGLFAFCHLSPIADLCWPDTADRVGDQLVRDYMRSAPTATIRTGPGRAAGRRNASGDCAGPWKR